MDSLGGNGRTAVSNGKDLLPVALCRDIFRIMVRSRAMEEQMIKMSKSGESYFWIGGPGEEAFNACLGLQVKKGRGPEYDYLHLHYRASAVLLGMGMPPLDAIRQAAMTVTDPHSMGRNFVGHYSIPKWNIVPVSSVVEVQYSIAPGTAMVQRRYGGDGITIVTGGDAGSAEGDFATCMVWSTRPDEQLPVLMIVMNNGWGISTAVHTQHGERHIADRGKPFGIASEVVDGNDPVASWYAIQRAMRHCRTKRRPYILEAIVSRLHGHSSASGAERVSREPDGLEMFERKLLEPGLVTQPMLDDVHDAATQEVDAAVEQALQEPKPTPADVLRHTYAPSRVDAVYPDDYTGLPV
jgi:2-oxoisovalerate dehydrogenase E1 component alpha subunit